MLVALPAPRSALLALLVLLLGCVGTGDLATRLSGQVVGTNEMAIGPGVVMIEIGNVHDGAYCCGGLIDESGRFSIELKPGANRYGIHLFVDGYQYLPAQIDVLEHQQIILTNPMIAWGVWMDLTGQHSWPTQPDDATLTRMPEDETKDDNPVLEDAQITWDGDLLVLTAEVTDPDGDLSRMVLAWDETTGASYALTAPGPADDRNNYPNGTWTTDFFAKLELDDDDPPDTKLHEPGVSQIQFVVSDNMCNDTDILYLTIPER